MWTNSEANVYGQWKLDNVCGMKSRKDGIKRSLLSNLIEIDAI